jgi:hypothetical protein
MTHLAVEENLKKAIEKAGETDQPHPVPGRACCLRMTANQYAAAS